MAGYFMPPWLKRNRDVVAIEKTANNPDPGLTNVKNTFNATGANPAPTMAKISTPQIATAPPIAVTPAMPGVARFPGLKKRFGV